VGGAGAEAPVGGAAVLLDVLVLAVLVGKTPEKSFAGHATGYIGYTVLAPLLYYIY